MTADKSPSGSYILDARWVFPWAETGVMFYLTFKTTVPGRRSGGFVVSQAVETKSFPPNYRPPLLTVSNHVIIVWGVGPLAVGALPFGFWLVRFSGMKMISLCLNEEGTSNYRRDSIRGAIKLGTCLKDSNFLYNSFSQFLEFHSGLSCSRAKFFLNSWGSFPRIIGTWRSP